MYPPPTPAPDFIKRGKGFHYFITRGGHYFITRGPGPWILNPGPWIRDPGPWIQDPGSWIQDLDPGFWILDPGFWILDPGSRILDAGYLPNYFITRGVITLLPGGKTQLLYYPGGFITHSWG